MSEKTCKATTTRLTAIEAATTTTITTRRAKNHERETNCAQNCHQMTNAWQHQSAIATATATATATPTATATATATEMAAHGRRRRKHKRSDVGRAAAKVRAGGFWQDLLALQLPLPLPLPLLLLLSLLLMRVTAALSTPTSLHLNETKENRNTAKQLNGLSVYNMSDTPTATPTVPPTATPPGIRENVMLPSSDPEREAQILYEKSLQEYHGSQHAKATAAAAAASGNSDFDSNANNGSSNASKTKAHTLHSVCELWLLKHCHCTGSLENLKLSCRSIGILAVPVNLPSEVLFL